MLVLYSSFCDASTFFLYIFSIPHTGSLRLHCRDYVRLSTNTYDCDDLVSGVSCIYDERRSTPTRPTSYSNQGAQKEGKAQQRSGDAEDTSMSQELVEVWALKAVGDVSCHHLAAGRYQIRMNPPLQLVKPGVLALCPLERKDTLSFPTTGAVQLLNPGLADILND